MTTFTPARVSHAFSPAQNAPFTATDAMEAGARPASVPFPRWQRARDRACAALLAGETRLLLTGPPGTGKTVLVHEIARILRYAGWHAAVRTAGVPSADSVAALTGHHAVLLIDEADRLSDTELRELEAGPHGALVLAGLDSVGLRWEAGARVSLSPLTPVEAREYAAQWLTMAGQKAPVSADAVERVVELSGGVPRLLSSVLGASIWMAGAEGAATVTPRHVEAAAALRACFLEDEGGAVPQAESVSASQHDRERIGKEPTDPCEPTGVSIDAGQRYQAPSLPPSRPRRGMVGPAFVTCIVLASGAGVALVKWPSEVSRAREAVLATVAGTRQSATQRKAVVRMEPATGGGFQGPESPPGPLPEARVAELEPEAPPRAPEAPLVDALPTPAESIAPVTPIPASVDTLDAADSRDGAIAPEEVSLHAPLPAEPPAALAESRDLQHSELPPEQAEAASNQTATALPVPSIERDGDVQSRATSPQSDEPASIRAQEQSATPAPMESVASTGPQVARSPGPEPQPRAGSPSEPLRPKPAPAAVAALLARADALVATGDIAAARLVYQRAVTLGSGQAATAIGRTYDPEFLAQLGVVGVVADTDTAAVWYRKGAALSVEAGRSIVGDLKTGE